MTSHAPLLTFAVALLVAGCSSSSHDLDVDVAAASAAEEVTPSCLEPSDHPFNLNGEIWALGDTQIQRATIFYWHGRPLTFGGMPAVPPSATFQIDQHQETGDAIHIEGHEVTAKDVAPKRIVVDLTRVADDPALGWWEQVVQHGTLRVTSAAGDADDEVIVITHGRKCDVN